MQPLTLSLFVSLVAAQTIVQDSWIAPGLPDLSVTIYDGQEYQLTWDSTLQNWFGQYSPQSTVTNVTLWIAAVQLSYAHVVQQYIDVTRTKQITWKASLPANEFADEQNWSFRFAPSNYTSLTGNTALHNEVDSPQFLYKAATTSSSSATTSTTSSSSPTSPTNSQTTTSGGTAAASTGGAGTTSSSKSSSLSGGAIAGIVIGALAGIALIGALFFLLFRLRRKDADLKNEQRQQKLYQESSTYDPRTPSMGGHESIQPYYAAQPLESQPQHTYPPAQPVAPTHELAGNDALELDSEQVKPPGELSGAYEPYRSPK
ncbi:hypothetical protein K461DRAFT_272472 [Myriangium duriaei CBS 260.36]|uniref:Mid2 domain-containing protein n=1 Tax=Myriangium duriaei CBS 260.36 TaxID=1168546 RepID=A0A9P4MC40_9PEZI|nr:hypothetical protein K461DRAFT_272472 [Myriangium duriaei CBS 260.36]